MEIQMEEKSKTVKCYFCGMEFIVREEANENTMYGWLCMQENCIRAYLKKLNDDQSKIIREDLS